MFEQSPAGRAVLQGATALLIWCAAAGSASAQLPTPMKESELKAAGARKVPAQEIRKLLVGNTNYVILLKNVGPGTTGVVVANYYRNDRIRVQKFPDGRKMESNWWLDGDSRCVEEKVIVGGHLCSSIWDFAGTLYLCIQPGGDCSMSFRSVPGNPENL
jgi:hypothetical protein